MIIYNISKIIFSVHDNQNKKKPELTFDLGFTSALFSYIHVSISLQWKVLLEQLSVI